MGATMAQNVTNSTKWRVLICIFLFYFVGLGFTNQFFNVILRTMVADMGWNPAQATLISSAMFGAMVWFVFVAGALLDKFSVKKMFLFEAILCGVAFILRGAAQGFIFFFALMIVYGVLSAFYIPTCVKLISLWFDGSRIALANGVLTSASPCGQLIANLFGYKIAMAIGGWKTLFIVCGIAIICVAVLSFFMMKERKSEDAALTSAILKKEDLTFWRNIGGVARTPGVWIYSVANACFLGMVYALMAYQNYIYQTDPGWGLDPSISGTVPAFSNMVSMCAYTLVPLVFMKLKIQKYWQIAAIFCAIVAITVASSGWMSYNYVWACASMAISGLMYGCCLPAPKVLMLQLPEVSGPRAGTAMGLYTTMERVGVTIFVAYLGPQILAWDPAVPGMSVLAGKFQFIMFVQPVLLAIGLLVAKKRYGNIFARVEAPKKENLVEKSEEAAIEAGE